MDIEKDKGQTLDRAPGPRAHEGEVRATTAPSCSRRSRSSTTRSPRSTCTDPNSLTEAEIRAALRKGHHHLQVSPLFCGSAYKYVGVQTLLNGVIDFLPTRSTFRRSRDHDAPRSRQDHRAQARPERAVRGLAFKIVDDKFGTLTLRPRLLRRARAGHARAQREQGHEGEHQPNVPDVGQRPHPARRAEAGDIVAGHRRQRGDDGRHAVRPRRAARAREADVPEPVISMSIEPKSSGDKDKLSNA
jgi:elongation factor G